MGRLKFDFHTDEDSAIPPVRESFVVEARDRARRGTDEADDKWNRQQVRYQEQERPGYFVVIRVALEHGLARPLFVGERRGAAPAAVVRVPLRVALRLVLFVVDRAPLVDPEVGFARPHVPAGVGGPRGGLVVIASPLHVFAAAPEDAAPVDERVLAALA